MRVLIFRLRRGFPCARRSQARPRGIGDVIDLDPDGAGVNGAGLGSVFVVDLEIGMRA